MAETRGDAYPRAAHDGEYLRQYKIAKIKLAGKLRIAPRATLWGDLAIQGAGSFAARDFPAT
jgi:hypothetical protein